MAAYYPAPSAPTKVGFDGQDVAQVASGGLVLVPGVGLAGTTVTAGARLQLDTLHLDAPEVVSLFAAGAPAVGDLGYWHNTRAARTAMLRALEVNLAVAPTTGDAANYYAVRASDGTSHADLPISTAGGRHYYLDLGSGALRVALYASAALPAPAANFGSGNLAQLATLDTFTPTEQLTVTGVRAFGGAMVYTSGGGAALAVQVRGSIIDAAGNVIASAYASTGAQTVNELDFVFDKAVTLDQGTTYGVAVDTWELNPSSTGPWTGFVPWMPVSPTGIGSLPYTAGTHKEENASFYAPKVGHMNWPDFLANVDGQVASAAFGNSHSLLKSPGAGVTGNGGAVSLAGDVTFSLLTVGAPAATALGSDLNLRALLDTGS